MKALNQLNFINSHITTNLVDYLVKKGNDSDDLLDLYSKKSGHRRGVYLI